MPCRIKKNETKKRNLLCTILEFIERNFRESITLKELARQIGYSYNYLSNYINKNLSASFSTLVNDYRVNYAKYLMKSSDMNMTEISNACGFITIRNFNRCFLQSQKMTPKQYKKSVVASRS